MTTFTRIEEGETPSIYVDVRRRLAKIDPNIYGGFMEHMGRCIYGGIYDPGNSLSDEHGYRTDVLEALRELNIPVIRYPGGNFVATYHWMDGVGPRDQRPSRPELAWLGTETNQFGTDEFLHWLSVLGPDVQPYFCLNFGTGTLDEALAWVEYCNGTRNTYYANLRRKNGREEPYNIKYWALGNEMWGPWQVGQMTAEDYSKTAAQWAKALKLLDPSLILILCGETGHSSWDYQVLKACIPYIDMHSIHIYTCSNTHLPNVTAPLSAERAIEIASSLIDLARIEAQIPPTKPKTLLCFDEWNVWDPLRAPGSLGAEEVYTLSDALAVSVWLNVFVRQSARVGMANIAQSVNVISPLMTIPAGEGQGLGDGGGGVLRQATWWPLLLFSRYMRGWNIGCHVCAGAYDGVTSPAWLQGVLGAGGSSSSSGGGGGGGGASWLDVSAVVNEGGVVSCVVVNISEVEDFNVELEGVVGTDVDVFEVNGADVKAVNTKEKEGVGLSERKWDGRGLFRFPKHSMTMLRWQTGKKFSEASKVKVAGSDTKKLVTNQAEGL